MCTLLSPVCVCKLPESSCGRIEGHNAVSPKSMGGGDFYAVKGPTKCSCATLRACMSSKTCPFVPGSWRNVYSPFYAVSLQTFKHFFPLEWGKESSGKQKRKRPRQKKKTRNKPENIRSSREGKKQCVPLFFFFFNYLAFPALPNLSSLVLSFSRSWSWITQTLLL